MPASTSGARRSGTLFAGNGAGLEPVRHFMPGSWVVSQVAPGGSDRTQPADLDSADRLHALMGACRSRTNADEVQEVAVHVESLRGHLPLCLARQPLSGPRGERISLEVADMRDV